MTGLLYNLLLAFVWAFLWGGVTVPRLLVGFAVGFLLLAMAERAANRTVRGRSRRADGRLLGDRSSGYAGRTLGALRFGVWFLGQLLLSNLRVAHDVVSVSHQSRPAVVAVPLDARTDLEITLLANLISLTPGTLSLDVAPDRRTLYVHAMFAADADAVRRELKSGLERRLLEVLR